MGSKKGRKIMKKVLTTYVLRTYLSTTDVGRVIRNGIVRYCLSNPDTSYINYIIKEHYSIFQHTLIHLNTLTVIFSFRPFCDPERHKIQQQYFLVKLEVHDPCPSHIVSRITWRNKYSPFTT